MDSVGVSGEGGQGQCAVLCEWLQARHCVLLVLVCGWKCVSMSTTFR